MGIRVRALSVRAAVLHPLLDSDPARPLLARPTMGARLWLRVRIRRAAGVRRMASARTRAERLVAFGGRPPECGGPTARSGGGVGPVAPGRPAGPAPPPAHP